MSLCIHRRWPASKFQWGIVNGPRYETVGTSYWPARRQPGRPSNCMCSSFGKSLPTVDSERATCHRSGSGLSECVLQVVSCGCESTWNSFAPLSSWAFATHACSLGGEKWTRLVKRKLKRNTTLLKGNLTNAAVFQILFPCKLKTSSALQFIGKTIAKYTHEKKKSVSLSTRRIPSRNATRNADVSPGPQ